MGTRARVNVAIGAAILGCVALGVSHASAASRESASVEKLASDKKQATPTTRPSAIGDDLIYDFVGPNVTDGAKPQDASKRSYTAGHFMMQLDGEP
jgi:hypothetical protein